MPKSTEELKDDLRQASGLEGFLVDNQKDFCQYTLAEYLNQLLAEKHLTKTDVVRASNLERTYAYHIFAGRKKQPARNKVISLALAMKLTPEETQYLLYYAGAEQLYVRNPRDSILWYALDHRLSVIDTNIMLQKMSELTLLNVGEELS